MAVYIRILTIDGGGIRGIIPGQILVELEQILQQKTQNPQARIADFFDLIAGTSTGGILTCLYLCPDPEKARPRLTAQDAVNFYLNYGPRIFQRSLGHSLLSFFGMIKEKYPAKYLETSLHAIFGDVKLSQLLKPCLIPAYNIEKRYAHFFTKHDAVDNPDYDFLVTDVTRAAAAAPTYFNTAGIWSLGRQFFPLIDGGVFANNPALCAFSEVYRSFTNAPSIEQIVMLSLSTGEDEKPIAFQKAAHWGFLQWAVPIISVLMSGNPETVDYQLQTIFKAAHCPANYCRIDPNLSDSMTNLDNATVENMLALVRLGQDAAAQHHHELERFADLLISGSPRAIPAPARQVTTG